MDQTIDHRQYAPATQRNRDPILAVLRQVLPSTGTVLEISSGTGEHALYFASQFAACHWISSDPNPAARASIAAWCTHNPIPTLWGPIALDVHDPQWPVEEDPLPVTLQGLDLGEEPIRAIVNINMIHIAPWSACLGLMAGARRLLPTGGVLYLYGPYKQGGVHTAPSNAAFDQSLRTQNPDWGVRNLEDVIAAARGQQLSLVSTHEMPANNLSVLFQA